MKKANLIRTICAFVLIVAVFCAVLFIRPFSEGKLTSDSDYYTFILEGAEYSLPFKASVLKENGWAILISENGSTDLAGHECSEAEAVKGEKRVGLLIGNPKLNKAKADECNVVGVKFYHGSNVDFLLRNDISYDFTKEQVFSTFGLPNVKTSEENQEKAETLCYSKKEEKFDKAEFYLYNNVLKKDKSGLPAVTLYNFGDLVFDISSQDVLQEEKEYEEPAELGNDLSSGLFELDGKIYRLPMRYADFKADWKLSNFAGSLPSNTYCDNYILRHKKVMIEIDPYLINDTDFATASDNATIYGFYTDSILKCNIKFPGGLDLSKTQDEMRNELSVFEKNKNTYKYEKNGFVLEIVYDISSGKCISFSVSKNKDKYESEGRYYLDYGKKEFFDITQEIKMSDKIVPMEKTYVPYYVPDDFNVYPSKYGYEDYSVGIKYLSVDESTQICFTQEPIVGNRKINVYGKSWARENSGFYLFDSELQMFFWEKDGYRFAIYAQGEVEKEEIFKMANSLITVEEYKAREEEKRNAVKVKIEGKTREEIEKIYGEAKFSFSGFYGGVYDIDGVEVSIYYNRYTNKVDDFRLSD